MPCSDDGQNAEDERSLRAKLNNITRLLCAACERLEEMDIEHWPKDLEDWWKVHKRWDAKRENRK